RAEVLSATPAPLGTAAASAPAHADFRVRGFGSVLLLAFLAAFFFGAAFFAGALPAALVAGLRAAGPFVDLDFPAAGFSTGALPLAGVRLLLARLCSSSDMKSTTLVAAPSGACSCSPSSGCTRPCAFIRFSITALRRSRNSSR